jgi:hypothetical protein
MSKSKTARPALSVVGFCGADDSVDPRLLAAISQRYPWVEWGVLFRDDKEGQPRWEPRSLVIFLYKNGLISELRFASAKWVEELVAVNKTSPMQVFLIPMYGPCFGKSKHRPYPIKEILVGHDELCMAACVMMKKRNSDWTWWITWYTAGRTLMLKSCAWPPFWCYTHPPTHTWNTVCYLHV